jgi:EamA domain-containing membrane protein RarD|nr:MAG TPA: hypothetical protein [Caudoviricetes sp.]
MWLEKGKCIMPIINPMYLYLIEILHNLDILNHIIFFVLAFVVCLMGFLYIAEEQAREEMQANKSQVTLLLVAFVISTLIVIFVPTKDAMYKILLAHYVTTDNIQLVNDAIKGNLQDYLNMLGETVKNMK